MENLYMFLSLNKKSNYFFFFLHILKKKFIIHTKRTAFNFRFISIIIILNQIYLYNFLIYYFYSFHQYIKSKYNFYNSLFLIFLICLFNKIRSKYLKQIGQLYFILIFFNAFSLFSAINISLE